jgi:photosystem II stability/assembly factor-like uncharacterized protein
LVVALGGGAETMTDTELCIMAIDGWYQNSINYDHTNPGKSYTPDFTRLVWQSTRRIGVGVTRSSSNRVIAIVMAFDPPGNRPGKFAANVLPTSLGHLEALDNVYTKTECDARFLRTGALDDYVTIAREGGIEVAESNAQAFRVEFDDRYYRKHYIDELFDTEVTLALQGFSNMFADDYYTKAHVDGSLQANEDHTQSVLADLSNDVQARIDAFDASFEYDYYTRSETDALLGNESSTIAAFSNHIASSYYDKDESDVRFALSEDHSALSNALYLEYASASNIADTYAKAVEVDALDARLSNDHYTKTASDARHVDIDRFLTFSNAVHTAHYDKDVSDARYAGSTNFEAWSNVVSTSYARLDVADGRYAPLDGYVEFSNDVYENYYTASEVDAELVLRCASACNFEAFREGVLAREGQDRSDLEALSNTVREEYFDRSASDLRYAAETSFATFSNLVVQDYYTRSVSDDRYASRDLQDTVATLRDDHDALATSRDELDALSNMVYDPDVYSRTDADFRFASAVAFEGLSNVVASRIDDTYSMSEVDARFATVEFADNLRVDLDDTYSRDEALDLFTEKTTYQALSNEVVARWADAVALSNFVHRDVLSEEESRSTFSTVEEVGTLRTELRNGYFTKPESDYRYATRDAYDGLLDRLATEYHDAKTAQAMFAAKSNFDALHRDVASNVYTKEEVDARFVSQDLFPSFSNALNLTDDGKLGIGTREPSRSLHVEGGVFVSGEMEVAGQFLAANDTTCFNPSYSWTGDTDTGMHRPLNEEDAISFCTGGKERLRISDADGLLVSGSLTVSNVVYADRYFIVEPDGSIREIGGGSSGDGGSKVDDYTAVVGEDGKESREGTQEAQVVRRGNEGFTVRRHNEAHVLGGNIYLSRAEADELVEQPFFKLDGNQITNSNWTVERAPLSSQTDDDAFDVVQDGTGDGKIVIAHAYEATTSSDVPDHECWNVFNDGDKELSAGFLQLKDEHVFLAHPQVADRELLGVHGAMGTGTWVVVGEGGTLLVSHDDGQTWEVRYTNTTRTLRAVSVSPVSGTWVAVGDEGLVMRSNDDADTWLTVYGYFGYNEDMDDKLAVLYDEEANVWIAVGTNGAILRSTDDGLTWTTPERVSLRRLYGITKTEVSYLTGSAVAASVMTVVGDENTVLQSSDGGATWTDVSQASTEVISMWGYFESTTATNDGSTWIAVSGSGQVLWSNDGGSTWTEADVPVARQEKLRSVFQLSLTGTWIGVGEDGVVVRSSVHSTWRTDPEVDPFDEETGEYKGSANLSGGYRGAWNLIDLPYPQHVHAYSVSTHNLGGRHPVEWKVYGSVEGDDLLWVELDGRTSGVTVPEVRANRVQRIELTAPTLTRYKQLAFVVSRVEGGGSGGGVLEVRSVRYSCSAALLTMNYISVEEGNISMTNANVGIGTRSPSYKLHVVGDVYASGTLTGLSDARTKRNVRPIEGALDKVLRLRGCTYQRKDGHNYYGDESGDDKRNRDLIGFIAQEVLGVVPEVVQHEACTDLYSLAYGNMVALMAEAIKDMRQEYTARLDGLEARLFPT